MQSDATGQAGPDTDTTSINCIDPSILVDTNGTVWMSYGSYSDGTGNGWPTLGLTRFDWGADAWPADHTGWHLQVQTNTLNAGLGTNWFDVANSSQTNNLTLPVDTSMGSMFYRLAYP